MGQRVPLGASLRAAMRHSVVEKAAFGREVHGACCTTELRTGARTWRRSVGVGHE